MKCDLCNKILYEKVSYYWVFKKGQKMKGPYFWNPQEENVLKNPKEVYKLLNQMT